MDQQKYDYYMANTEALTAQRFVAPANLHSSNELSDAIAVTVLARDGGLDFFEILTKFFDHRLAPISVWITWYSPDGAYRF
jgi:hypothetical protein